MDELIKGARRLIRRFVRPKPALLGVEATDAGAAWADIDARVTEYVDFPYPPGFALMLDGSWGSGKTYFLDEFVKRRKVANPEFVCANVSLYGLQSAADISRELLGAVYPLFRNKGVAVGRKLVTAGLAHFGLRSEIGLQDLIGFKADVFVFDDLERCNMPLNVALGYINGLVEHAKQKVIIVANQSEISNDEKYARVREKLVGQTVHMSQNVTAALDDFLSKVVTPEARTYLLSIEPAIREVYGQSNLNNLRLLRQTIWDFEKYLRHFPENCLADKAAADIVSRFFFAVSLELKAGNLQEADLVSRAGWDRFFRRNGEEPSPLQMVQERYPSVNLSDMRVPSEPMLDLILRGRAGAAITASLLQCPLFAEAPKERSWQVIWSCIERDEDQIRSAIAELKQEFGARSYTATGELLHVFAVWLWMARRGFIDRKPALAVQDCRDYISDLADRGMLEEEEPGAHQSRSEGWAGRGFMDPNGEEFGAVMVAVSTARKELFDSRLPAKARDLMTLLTKDFEAFLRQLVFIQGSESVPYAQVPILMLVDPEEFLSTVFSLPAAQHHSVLLVFKMRFESLSPSSRLREELPWVSRVAEALRERILKADPVEAYRLGMFLDHYVLPQLQAHEQLLPASDANSLNAAATAPTQQAAPT